MNVENVQVDHFRIPLPVVLSDSTHGDMSHFGLITVRIECAGGHRGLGYTYCVGDIGGITPWLEVARLADEKNLPVTTHGVHDLQVHLLAAVPNASYLEVHGFGLDRFMAHPLVIENGMARAPDRAGHGVELDWAALEPHRA